MGRGSIGENRTILGSFFIFPSESTGKNLFLSVASDGNSSDSRISPSEPMGENIFSLGASDGNSSDQRSVTLLI